MAGEARAEQKVPVAAHHVHRRVAGRGSQGGDAGVPEAVLGRVAGAVQHVIAHPHLEQIAQDDERIEPTPVQVAAPSRGRGGVMGLQVQVRNHIHPTPFGPGFEGGPGVQSTTAFSITTSVTGTSS